MLTRDKAQQPAHIYPRTLRYRPEIDGLRTIAVVSVVLYHAGFQYSDVPLFTGGFLGVDIFFVISGFLITKLLLKDLETGRFSILSFYERRARRILPALLCVMAATVPVAWLTMTPNALIEFSKSIAASLAFSSNVFFWLQDSYTAEPSQLKPFLHTWSLSLEEQFYLIFPVFLYLAWRYARAHVLRYLVIASLASLAIAQVLSVTYSDANFFLMPSRAWELLIGSILALDQRAITGSVPKWLVNTLPAVCLAAIIIPVLTYSDQMPHPSLWTLAPVLGTAGIIAFSRPQDAVIRFLSTRPMVQCGLISYSFYLWHFPVFAFGRIMTNGAFNTATLIAWILLSLVLAYASWRFVETPFRNRNSTSLRAFSAAAVAATVALLANTVLAVKEVGIDRYAVIPAPLMKTFREWRNLQNPNVRCVDQTGFLNPESWCQLGRNDSELDFMVVGDSHAIAQGAHFHAAAKKLNLGGKLVSRSGCPILLGLEPSRGVPASQNCLDLAEKVLAFATQQQVRQIFFALRWNYYVCGEPQPDCGFTQKTRLAGEPWSTTRETRLKNLTFALERTAKAYGKHGIKLTLVAQVPHQPAAAKDIYSTYFHDPASGRLSNLSVSSKSHRDFTSDARRLLDRIAAEQEHVRVADQSTVLCRQDGPCLIGTEETSYYRDKDHLSVGAVQLLTPWTEHQLGQNKR